MLKRGVPSPDRADALVMAVGGRRGAAQSIVSRAGAKAHSGARRASNSIAEAMGGGGSGGFADAMGGSGDLNML